MFLEVLQRLTLARETANTRALQLEDVPGLAPLLHVLSSVPSGTRNSKRAPPPFDDGNEPRGAAGLLHALANDRQTQAGASLLGGEERFPNTLAQIAGDAWPIVLHQYYQSFVFNSLSDAHFPARRRCLQRVEQQIRKRDPNRGNR